MSGRSPHRPRRGGSRTRGFTLVEIAIVLLVVGVLARTLIVPLGERVERRRHDTTHERLEAVRQALLGHLVTSGTLPCPLAAEGRAFTADPTLAVTAVATSPPTSPPTSSPPCRHGEGHVPSAALGTAGPVDERGALLDAWQRPLRYAVSLVSGAATPGTADMRGPPVWTTPGAAAALGIDALTADLVLCEEAASGTCPRESLRADALAFVVLSSGADDSARDAQAENLDGDTLYALAPPSAVDGHRFDDLLVWASRNELAYWLLRAEWLP